MNKHNFWYSQELRCDILSDIQLGYLPNIGIVQSWDLQMVLVSNPVVWRWKVKLLQQPPLWISLTWGLPITCLLLCFKEPKKKIVSCDTPFLGNRLYFVPQAMNWNWVPNCDVH
jgi:hypothetical protein